MFELKRGHLKGGFFRPKNQNNGTVFSLMNYNVYVGQGTWAVGMDIISIIHGQERSL